QPFVVENRGGAGGTVGTGIAAKEKPDGHVSLLASAGPMATSLSMYSDALSYDVLDDFVPISTVADVTIAVVTNPKFPANSIEDVIRIAGENPGSVRTALPAVGSMHHLLTELFQTQAGIKLSLIPYKGSSPAL